MHILKRGYNEKMFRSKRPRELLNEIKWRDLDLSRCEIYYVHRGAPNNTKIIRGDEIEGIGSSFFTFKGANAPPDSEGRVPSVMIPYHRIFRITYEGRTIYEK